MNKLMHQAITAATRLAKVNQEATFAYNALADITNGAGGRILEKDELETIRAAMAVIEGLQTKTDDYNIRERIKNISA